MALTHPAFASSHRLQHAARNSPPLARGERGPSVAIIQAALLDLGYKLPRSTGKSAKPDGKFGDETWHVIKRFQHDRKLTAVGQVGRETLAVLDRLMMAASPITATAAATAPHRT